MYLLSLILLLFIYFSKYNKYRLLKVKPNIGEVGLEIFLVNFGQGLYL